MSEDKAASFFEEVFDSLRGSGSAKLKAWPLYAHLLSLVPARSVDAALL
jgi:hypothetical protein